MRPQASTKTGSPVKQALAMGTALEHWERAQNVADSTRRHVIALNTGGIGLVFSVAGWLAAKGAAPSWAFCPVVFFVMGLLFVGISMLLAKNRELKRFNEAREGRDPHALYFSFYKRSFVWDAAAFLVFACGTLAALISIPVGHS
jgi:hypothetical protein